MPAWSEMLGNKTVCGKEPLRLSRGLEPLYPSLPLAGRLVGVFRTIV